MLHKRKHFITYCLNMLSVQGKKNSIILHNLCLDNDVSLVSYEKFVSDYHNSNKHKVINSLIRKQIEINTMISLGKEIL
jgi:hypothetical protein